MATHSNNPVVAPIIFAGERDLARSATRVAAAGHLCARFQERSDSDVEEYKDVLDGEDRAVVRGQRSSRQPPWPGLVAASCQQTIHGNVFIQQRLSRLNKVVQETSDRLRDRTFAYGARLNVLRGDTEPDQAPVQA